MRQRTVWLLVTLLAGACGDDSSANPGGGDGDGDHHPQEDAGSEPHDGMDAAADRDAANDEGFDGSVDPVPDAGSDASTGTGDAGGDAGTACAPFEMPSDCTIENFLPTELRCTGLYQDFAAREIACDVRPYAPAYELWSDGAVKHRYLYLPPGTKIDVTDRNNFGFPVGTQLWKEFRVPTSGGGTRLAETRLLRKAEIEGAAYWLVASYVWSEDQQNAVKTDPGMLDLYGTGHTVPSRNQCQQCHNGRPDSVLGFDLIMLGPGATGVTREVLINEHLLEDRSTGSGEPAVGSLNVSVPGDAVERAALGYLHANCGITCHNETGMARARMTGLQLRLEYGELATVHDTDAVRTAINKAPDVNVKWGNIQHDPPVFYDIRPADLDRSLLLQRMKVRSTTPGVPDQGQMPEIGTNRVDPTGVQTISVWIEQMTTARGYPPGSN